MNTANWCTLRLVYRTARERDGDGNKRGKDKKINAGIVERKCGDEKTSKKENKL